MLDLAKKMLRNILEELRPAIRAEIPLVGLEPSCMAIFRDELLNLMPHDEDAKRLSKNAMLFSQYVTQHLKEFELPQVGCKAVVQSHCHHSVIFKFDSEEELMKRLGLDFEVLDSGCCGMAGSFGFEKEHYDVSMACGERVLLPALRQADDDMLVIADGFSCKEQIVQATDKRPLHLAQVVQAALQDRSIREHHAERVSGKSRGCLASTVSRRALTGAAIAGFAALLLYGAGQYLARRERAGSHNVT